MTDIQAIRAALYQEEPPTKHQLRAVRTRAEALSPVRIVFSFLTLPPLALAVALSIYVRTSDYDPPDAIAHLVARGGCGAAHSIGLAPSYRGQLGYHARNDVDGDGIACNGAADQPVQVVEKVSTEPVNILDTSARMKGGAKFVRPLAKP